LLLSREVAESRRDRSAVGIPEIIAGEVVVLPADRSKVGEQGIRDDLAAKMQVIAGTPDIDGVPKGDGGGDDGKPVRAVLLRLNRAISQPAEAMKADGTSEGIPGLAFVELHGRLPPEGRQLEPVEHEQCPLDPTDFAQGQRQAVLTRISSEALEEQRGALAAPVRTESPIASFQWATISFSSTRPAMTARTPAKCF
jgi:hypothetical protein